MPGIASFGDPIPKPSDDIVRCRLGEYNEDPKVVAAETERNMITVSAASLNLFFPFGTGTWPITEVVSLVIVFSSEPSTECPVPFTSPSEMNGRVPASEGRWCGIVGLNGSGLRGVGMGELELPTGSDVSGVPCERNKLIIFLRKIDKKSLASRD